MILWSLFQPDLGNVPQVDTTVSRGRSKDRFVHGGPREGQDFVGVGFERVEFEFEVAKIPKCDRLDIMEE